MKQKNPRGRPKAQEEPRNLLVAMRVNKIEFKRIQSLWPIYTKEGISDYLRMCVFGYKKIGSKKGVAR